MCRVTYLLIHCSLLDTGGASQTRPSEAQACGRNRQNKDETSKLRWVIPASAKGQCTTGGKKTGHGPPQGWSNGGETNHYAVIDLEGFIEEQEYQDLG